MAFEQTSTYWARIYIAGPIEQAKQIIRRECMREGLCVTITPTDYMYTGGEEAGYIVELVNYPRFPSTETYIMQRAVDLGALLREETYQHSYMVMTPTDTFWYSNRENK